MIIVSQHNPLNHYKWGKDCEGWNLVENEYLNIKMERMSPGSTEELHHHNQAQQFFYILKGLAIFEIEGEKQELNKGEGVYIEKGKKHRISNETESELEFLLVSQPPVKGDRFPDAE